MLRVKVQAFRVGTKIHMLPDETAVVQAAFDGRGILERGRAYRITRPLLLDMHGENCQEHGEEHVLNVLTSGEGEDPVVFWDGPEDEAMVQQVFQNMRFKGQNQRGGPHE